MGTWWNDYYFISFKNVGKLFHQKKDLLVQTCTHVFFLFLAKSSFFDRLEIRILGEIIPVGM